MLVSMARRHPLVDLVTDPARIDEMYGLEPVFEPADAPAASRVREFLEIRCPSCGEVSGTMIDLTSDDRRWIEDCQVCCHPMLVEIEIGEHGGLVGVTTQRSG
ncbi:MAG: hypothetical protein AMXMBFR37_23400 [Steroidobacteraceae bacterium]